MNYIYNDEDNAPMIDYPFDGPHNPTVYNSRAEMKAMEQELPFTDPPEHPDGCWNCSNYDGYRCHVGWNNNDEIYYDPDTDDKDPDDWCPLYDKDESINPEEFFDEEDC